MVPNWWRSSTDFRPRETRLALALVRGLRLDEIADEFGLSRHPVSYTLKNLFRKTETDRQADLISLFLSNVVSVASPGRVGAGSAPAGCPHMTPSTGGKERCHRSTTGPQVTVRRDRPFSFKLPRIA